MSEARAQRLSVALSFSRDNSSRLPGITYGFTTQSLLPLTSILTKNNEQHSQHSLSHPSRISTDINCYCPTQTTCPLCYLVYTMMPSPVNHIIILNSTLQCWGRHMTMVAWQYVWTDNHLWYYREHRGWWVSLSLRLSGWVPPVIFTYNVTWCDGTDQ